MGQVPLAGGRWNQQMPTMQPGAQRAWTQLLGVLREQAVQQARVPQTGAASEGQPGALPTQQPGAPERQARRTEASSARRAQEPKIPRAARQ